MRNGEPIDVDERALDDAVLEALAELHAEPPPPRLAARVQAAAAAETRLQRARGSVRRWRLVGAVAASLAIVGGGLLVQSRRLAGEREVSLAQARHESDLAREQQSVLAAQHGALTRDNAALTARLEAQTRQLAALQESVAEQTGVLRILAGPRPRVATLAAKLDVPAYGRVMLDPTAGAAAVLLAGLDPALGGKVYELWTIRGSEAPEPAALLTVSPDGTAWARVDALARPADVTAFAVSIEPFGGSKSPTGPIILAGPIA